MSAAWLWTQSRPLAQERGAKLVELCAVYLKVAARGYSIETPRIGVAEDTTDEFDWQTMDQLILFTPLTGHISRVSRPAFRRRLWRLCA